MARNIKEYVVDKIINYSTQMQEELKELHILQHLIGEKVLRCDSCKQIVCPIDLKELKFQERWIAPCDFCYISEFDDLYAGEFHDHLKRGLGDPPCATIYCRKCVLKTGYATLFSRYSRLTNTSDHNFEGDFYNRYDQHHSKVSLNVCKKCVRYL